MSSSINRTVFIARQFSTVDSRTQVQVIKIDFMPPTLPLPLMLLPAVHAARDFNDAPSIYKASPGNSCVVSRGIIVRFSHYKMHFMCAIHKCWHLRPPSPC